MSGFIADEKIALLFKKNQGLPSTEDAFGVPTDLGLEPVQYAARPFILPSQIWGDQVPRQPPPDLDGDPDMLTDDMGNRLEGSPIGRASQHYPYMRRFYRLPMQQVFQGTTNYHSWTVMYGNDVLLQRSIPVGFDQAYMYRLEYKSGTRYFDIVYGASGGQWYVDPDTGILTFYDFPQVQNKVSVTSPPYISFYRYEGRTGFPFNGASVDEQGTGTTGIQGPVIFNGGDKQPHFDGDGLAAVKIDDRNPTYMPMDSFLQGLQIGGDYDGSWRIVVRGGGGRDDSTTFEVQNRRRGVWRSQWRLNDKEFFQNRPFG